MNIFQKFRHAAFDIFGNFGVFAAQHESVHTFIYEVNIPKNNSGVQRAVKKHRL